MASILKNFGLLKIAAGTPRLKVADLDYNLGEIIKLLKKADKSGVSIVVFPELCFCGYTIADLYFQKLLQEKILRNLARLMKISKNFRPIFLVGLPLALEGKLFNTAAIIHKGKILGIVPKTYIPGYKEFYEERWFASSRDLVSKEINLFGKIVPIGADLLFEIENLPGATLGVEICEDLWTPLPPSSFQALKGATIIANLSASNDLVGKADYRRNLVAQQSARTITGYIYSSSGVHESTTDVVFGGHAIIAENGNIIEESERFNRNSSLIISEIDLEHLLSDREKTTSFGEPTVADKKEFRIIRTKISLPKNLNLTRRVDPNPFVPSDILKRDERAEEIFSIQNAALAKRLESSGIKKLIIGLSGGLDSTLALLVSVKTSDLLGLKRKNIYTYTMPGFGTSARTNKNAKKLAKALGANIEEIDITEGVLRQFKDIKHNDKTDDVVYENAQARYRTFTLMDKANQMKGLVVGTGDLSEIALGWNTYTGDHIAHYNVNCGVPKTLVKYLVKWAADSQFDKKIAGILEDILATPISPELKKADKGEVTQKTENLIGPYELHDFFLYHFLRWGSAPKKILFLAHKAWGKKYSEKELKKWLKLFLNRFFKSQWKRSVATDGPKVGSISLSPRGDWRMPSDAEASIWVKDLDDKLDY